MLAYQFITALNDDSATQQESTLGMIRIEGAAVYKYVKFSGTKAVAAGDPVCYVISDKTYSQVDGTNSVLGAGIAMAAHAISNVRYGWIQIMGLSAAITTLTSGTAGQSVTSTGAADAAVKVSGAVTDQVVGIVANATDKTLFLAYPWC